MVDTTPRLNDFNAAHRTCFDLFFPSHDIIELRNGGINGVRISLELIHKGISTQLSFGKNADLTSVVIDGNNNVCDEQNEITSAIRIHDANIIKSECTGSFTYIKFDRIWFLVNRTRDSSRISSISKIYFILGLSPKRFFLTFIIFSKCLKSLLIQMKLYDMNIILIGNKSESKLKPIFQCDCDNHFINVHRPRNFELMSRTRSDVSSNRIPPVT